MSAVHDNPPSLAVIGGGPAGLMAAEVARAAGVHVDVYDAMGSVGRKFLIAGKGGLNLTHSDQPQRFAERYRHRVEDVSRWLQAFGPDALRAWARGLGVDTFIGTSGRVFPLDRKAAPLLRGWVRRLREQGVRFHVHHRWNGWQPDGGLRFATPDGEFTAYADATVLAMGGGSWPQLGSDGAWVPALGDRGIDIAELQPSNCGFDVAWSPHFSQRHAGSPLKAVVAEWNDSFGKTQARQGECVVTGSGIEGSLVYAMSADLRDAIARDGCATIHLDLAPGRDIDALRAALAAPRGHRSASEHLRRRVGIDGVKAGLLREVLPAAALDDAERTAATIKRLPLVLLAARPLAEAISTAGGVTFGSLDGASMLTALPGTFCAGEMIDWEAPTGGYLLSACFASGWQAGHGAVTWLARQHDPPKSAG